MEKILRFYRENVRESVRATLTPVFIHTKNDSTFSVLPFSHLHSDNSSV